ncbi:Hypothetical predicted protein [Paramuricea clavata]|uniref:Uncharacterized protein n=1 Tax=Paramuricea clavata TaxID=317549 RepID=A0A6S7G9K7_PARCT|nr:Hypothetical predicted protein [Paramuricea clavata]
MAALQWLCYIFIICGSYSLLSDNRNSAIPKDCAGKDSGTTSASNFWCFLEKSSFILTANLSSLVVCGRSSIVGLYIIDDFGSCQTSCGSTTSGGFDERDFEANEWIYFRQSKLLSNMRVSVSGCFSRRDKYEQICICKVAHNKTTDPNYSTKVIELSLMSSDVNVYNSTYLVFNKRALAFLAKGRHRRSKRPCVYYANSTATFQLLLEGDLVFKLNPGPEYQRAKSTFSRHYTCKARPGRNASNLI